MPKQLYLPLVCLLLCTNCYTYAQQSDNDTIRLGVVTERGHEYPMVFLPEVNIPGLFMNDDDRNKRNRLRRDIYAVYPYAITASYILKDVHSTLETMDNRRDRKAYLKTIDKQLDNVFKESLKNMTIDQGHLLIKLIDRQTGQSCYSIIRELKGGVSALMWQSLGVFFNNNLRKPYDPEDKDKEIEGIVKDLESSNLYRYQLIQQDALLRKLAQTEHKGKHKN
jgi:hypothetical protein